MCRPRSGTMSLLAHCIGYMGHGASSDFMLEKTTLVFTIRRYGSLGTIFSTGPPVLRLATTSFSRMDRFDMCGSKELNCHE